MSLRGSDRRRPAWIRHPVGPGLVPPASASVELARDSLALGADLDDLLRREAALADPDGEQLLVLPLPRPVERDPDVELEVLRVVALPRGLGRCAPERLLDVDVPACEPALRTAPEQPDRVRLSGPLQHQHAVAVPVRLPVPGVPAAGRGPGAGREPERRPVGDEGGEQLLVVPDHDHRHLEPCPPVVQDLAPDHDLPFGPHDPTLRGGR